MVGSRLLHNPLEDLDKNNIDSTIELEEQEDINHTESKSEEEFFEEDQEKKKKEDKTESSSESSNGFFKEITGLVAGFLKSHVEKNLEVGVNKTKEKENKTEEIDEDTKELAEIKDKLLEGILG
ncbi:hypothetical protein GF361_00390 [Candidatus Woesearchaeota archaeon]|nr:hypothetical protein [Candidatus Woesearchaeota archaeon]